MLNNLTRYYHTIRFLKFKQVFGQVAQRINHHRYRSIPIVNPLVRQIANAWIPSPLKVDRLDEDGVLTALNHQAMIKDNPEIWQDVSHSMLWCYHLHYFHYVRPGDTALIIRWINENPMFKGIGWDPYPTSLRIVNWIKFLLTNSLSMAEKLCIENSLIQQTSYLTQHLETHILANHYLANAKALYFAGCYFMHTEWQTERVLCPIKERALLHLLP